MEILDVPEVNQLPELSGEGENPVGFADMILTSLLNYPAATLFAEFSEEEPCVGWAIDPHDNFHPQNLDIAISPSLVCFRAVLERLGEHYMGGQVKNGYASRLLRHAGQLHECHFYLSNSEASGYWIRICTATSVQG